jgi:hypothetical protein
MITFPPHPSTVAARLEQDHPDYQVWWVPKATSGALTWRAQRWEDPTPAHSLTADSSEELETLILRDEEEIRP